MRRMSRPSKPWGCRGKTLTPTPEPAGYCAGDVAGERGERGLDSSPLTPVGSARGSPLGRESFGKGGTDDSAMEATTVARSGSDRGPWFGGGLASHRVCRVHVDRRELDRR